MLELDAVNVPETRRYVREVWKNLEAAGIPFTLHWGKFNTYLTGPRVVGMYGQDKVDTWRNARANLLESAGVSRCFDNPFLRSAGLAT